MATPCSSDCFDTNSSAAFPGFGQLFLVNPLLYLRLSHLADENQGGSRLVFREAADYRKPEFSLHLSVGGVKNSGRTATIVFPVYWLAFPAKNRGHKSGTCGLDGLGGCFYGVATVSLRKQNTIIHAGPGAKVGLEVNRSAQPRVVCHDRGPHRAGQIRG